MNYERKLKNIFCVFRYDFYERMRLVEQYTKSKSVFDILCSELEDRMLEVRNGSDWKHGPGLLDLGDVRPTFRYF